MDREAWHAEIHGVTKSRTQVSDWTELNWFLPSKSHGQKSLVGCSPWGLEESDATEWLHFHFSLPCIGEGNGNSLQCSCLEYPRDEGAWWAAIYGSHRVRHDWSELAPAAAMYHEIVHFPSPLKKQQQQQQLDSGGYDKWGYKNEWVWTYKLRSEWTIIKNQSKYFPFFDLKHEWYSQIKHALRLFRTYGSISAIIPKQQRKMWHYFCNY